MVIWPRRISEESSTLRALEWEVVLSQCKVVRLLSLSLNVFTCQRLKSSHSSMYRVLLLSKSQPHFLPFASVQLPWGKDEISVNLFTASFVFCGVVKLKTTFTNILMIKRAREISITSTKAVCIKEKWYVISKRTFVLEWSSFTKWLLCRFFLWRLWTNL